MNIFSGQFSPSWFQQKSVVKEENCSLDYNLRLMQGVNFLDVATAISSVAIVIVGLANIIFSYSHRTDSDRNVVMASGVLFSVLGAAGFYKKCMHVKENHERLADLKAVKEYATKPYPSESARYRINHSVNCARLLASKKEDEKKCVNKCSEDGNRLLDYVNDLEIIKPLIDGGYDIKAKNKFGESFFEYALGDQREGGLEYILKNKLVTPGDFDSTEQVKIWLRLGSIKASELLKQYGFDVNVRDENRHTPLLKLVIEAPSTFYFGAGLDLGAHVTALLDCGADPLTPFLVEENGKKTEKNIIQINTNSIIAEIFKKWEGLQKPVDCVIVAE